MRSSQPRKRNIGLMLSNILFALALIGAAVVGYLYFFDNTFFQEHPPTPVCETGQNELICVVDALKLQDFDNVSLGRYTATSDQLSQPGQVIEIDGLNGFLFVYPSASESQGIADREKDAASINTDTMTITARISERPLNEGMPLHVFEHSNIIFILVGGSDDEVRNVEAAINSLP